jgi:hypothetical protein
VVQVATDGEGDFHGRQSVNLVTRVRNFSISTHTELYRA